MIANNTGRRKTSGTKLINDKTGDIQQVKDEKPKVSSKELVETLFENPYCKTDFIVRKSNIERKAANRYLTQLCDIGLLEKSKKAKENIYINLQLMDLLSGNLD